MVRKYGILLSAIMAVLMVLAGCGKSKEPVVENEPNVQTNAQLEEVNTRETMLYLADASGYIVPVMRKIPWETGIGKAALECLVAGETEEDAKMAAKGMYAPLPNGTEIELDINNAMATVDLTFKKGGPATKEEEEMLIKALVNTLLEFPTIDKVKILQDGKAAATMPKGAKVASTYSQPLANVEPKGTTETSEGKAQLYFANSNGKLLIPVMRVMNTESLADVVKAMTAPEQGSGLVSLLPEGCEVLSATVSTDGTAKVDFSKEFKKLADKPDMEKMAIKGLTLACKGVEGIEGVQIYVEGKPYEADVSTMAVADNGWLNLYE